MKIIFLLDFFEPKFSSVSKCMYNIANSLSMEEEVTIITQDGKKSKIEIEKYNNCNLIRGYNTYLQRKNNLENEINMEVGIKRFFIKIKYNIFKFKRIIKYLLKKYSIYDDYVKTYLDGLLLMEKIDLIIPTCTPFESVFASLIYARDNKNTKIIPILYDRYTDNTSLHRISINRLIKKRKHLELEKEMIDCSTRIFAMNQLKYFYIKYFPSDLIKINFIEHPLVINNELYERNVKNSNDITCVYAGVFYKKARNPRCMLELFSNISKNIKLNLFSTGDCISIVDKYIRKCDNIFEHGIIGSNDLINEYNKSNILISIGNNKSRNVASKIFEYMSVGKPIIHFYKNDSDPILEILKSYPAVLLIDEKKIDLLKDKYKIKCFCEDNKNLIFDFNVIEKIYNYATPNYIKNEIMRVLK